jgi:hypothetical protein
MNKEKIQDKELVKFLESFDVNQDGIITNPGKFEGEDLKTPYFYFYYLEGVGYDIEDETMTFDIEPQDVEVFPELKGETQFHLFFKDNGFVVGEAF